MHILQLKHINLTIQINQRNKDNDNKNKNNLKLSKTRTGPNLQRLVDRIVRYIDSENYF